MIAEILSVLFLLIPLFWEVHDDRNGDIHPSKTDISTRILMSIITSIGVTALGAHNYVEAQVLSIGLFTSIFPYAVNYAQRNVTEDRRWWAHLSKKAWPDRVPIWIGIGWGCRLVVNLVILIITIIIYL